MLPFSEYELAQKIAEEVARGHPALYSGFHRFSGRRLRIIAGRMVEPIVDQLLDAAGEQKARVGGVQLRVSDSSHFGFLVGVRCCDGGIVDIPR
jgi:hypothetical protein